MIKFKKQSKYLKERKQRRKQIKKWLYILLVLQSLMLITLKYIYWNDFLFGQVSTAIFIIINATIVSIRVFIIESNIHTKNDIGIKIWWLCCLRFGQKGVYTEGYKVQQIKKNIQAIKNTNNKSFQLNNNYSIVLETKNNEYFSSIEQQIHNKTSILNRNKDKMFKNSSNPQLYNLKEKLRISVLD